MTLTYTCRYCNEIKELNSHNFKVERRTKLGFDSVCRVCRRIERNTLRENNKEVVLEKEKQYRETDKYKQYHTAYYSKNQEKLREQGRKNYVNNPIPYLNRSKEQKIRLGKQYNEYQKNYRRENKDKLNEYSLNRYHTNIRYKLRGLIGGGIRKKLHGQIKECKSIEYIGCTWEFLIGYLESKFRDGMNWTNLGTLWQIDHIIPCVSFDFNDNEQIKKCYNYTNLQPLLIHENASKQDKLPDGTLGRNVLTNGKNNISSGNANKFSRL